MQHSVGNAVPAASSLSRIVGVGEAMVELSPAGEGLYQLGFAGDTFNTVWHMSQLLGDRASTASLPGARAPKDLVRALGTRPFGHPDVEVAVS